MKSKVFVISTLVLALLIVFASQALAAGATSNPQAIATNTRTRTRTPTKAPTRTLSRTPTLTRTRTPTPVASVTGSVLIHNGGCCMGGPVGTTINIDTAFSASSTGGAVTEMRIGHQACNMSPDLSSVAWEPFVTSKSFPYTIIVQNWVGYYVDVQYRDALGNVSPVYCDDISIEGMPPSGTGTPSTPTITPTATSALTFTGSVLIHNGGCCMGGPVGTTINIDTAFSASSSAGAVTEMRIAHQSCSSSPDLSSVAWEPYTTSKVFPHTIIAINWTSYYVDVQYRDAAGNVSPIYCDDIAIEGMPALTPTAGTGTPTNVITKTKTPTPTSTAMPGADFAGTPLSGNAPLTVQFTALNSSVLSTCTWNFGDGVTQTFNGQFSVCPSTTHTYTTAGSYTVSLSVMKVTGATNSMTKTNYVQVTGSSATLTPTPTLTRTPTPSPTKTVTITGT